MLDFSQGWADIWVYRSLLLKGFLATIGLAVSVMLLSLMLGLGLAVIRFYRLPLLSWLSGAYVYIIRSVPLVLLLALFHYGILPFLLGQPSFLVSAFVVLILVTTGYIAEILRGGFHSLSTEEMRTAESLGLNVLQRLRYVYIPLVLTRMMPSLLNQWVTLIKDTSLASIIGVIELTRAAEIIYERTLHEVPLLIFIAVVYFVVCYSLSQWVKYLEFQQMTQPVQIKG